MKDSSSSPFAWLFGGIRRTGEIPPSSSSNNETVEDKKKHKKKSRGGGEEEEKELGVTEELRSFVEGFTIETFKNFPLPQPQGDQLVSSSDGSRPPNVRKDLTDWQERHATLILTTVKEISQLRYVLCPRHLKEIQFWKIYFVLVKNYVAPYEILAIQKEKLKMMELGDEKTVGNVGGYEVEMTEAKQLASSSFPMENDP